MTNYPSEKCFSGYALFFSVLSGVALCAMVPLSMLFVLTCNETRNLPNNIFGKYTLRREVTLQILKAALAFSYLFDKSVN